MKWLALMLVIAACADERQLAGPCTDCTVHFHPAGILDPASDDFHGKELARHGGDLKVCAACHGDDFAGGKAQKSCLTCHANGPSGCASCHATEPGAHATHIAAQLDCSECHIKPSSWEQPGHTDGQGAVVFGARAALGGVTPRWDGTTCTVYCHLQTTPSWNATPIGGCDRCHGAPPASHQRADCATCHPSDAPHIDGIVQVGRTAGCAGCHGSAASAAPPFDLAGNTATTAIGVGAHQAHLQSSALRGPIACSECHVVPQSVTDPGHLDPAPADVRASLGWDRQAQTCATAWCHGAGRPVWTHTGEVTCGSCHGIPPANHPAGACVTCHALTVDAQNNIISTHHIDGVVDAN